MIIILSFSGARERGKTQVSRLRSSGLDLRRHMPLKHL